MFQWGLAEAILAQGKQSVKRTQHLSVVLAKMQGKVRNYKPVYNEMTGFTHPSFIYFLYSEHGDGRSSCSVIDLALGTGCTAVAVVVVN